SSPSSYTHSTSASLSSQGVIARSQESHFARSSSCSAKISSVSSVRMTFNSSSSAFCFVLSLKDPSSPSHAPTACTSASFFSLSCCFGERHSSGNGSSFFAASCLAFNCSSL